MNKATKRTLIVLAFVVGLSYFAFTLVFFDPFEGSYMDEHEGKAVALEYVVPREVDFFFHKRALENDFELGEFPVPSAWDRIRLSRRWQKFERTPLYDTLKEELQLGEKIGQIQDATAQVPLLDPLTDLVGRDLAVFGRIKGRGYEESEVAAVFLGSGMSRFAYEAASNGLTRSLLGMPFEVEENEDGVRKFTLESGDEIHLFRHKDLFIAGTGPLLLAEIVQLMEMGKEQSLGWSKEYHNTVAQDVAVFAGMESTAPTEEEDLEQRLQMHLNLSSMFSLVDFDDTFLDPREQVSRWLLGKLFSPRYFNKFTLDLGFGDTIDLRGMFGYNRDAAESSQTGFYNRKTFELRQAMDRVAALVPEETFLLLAARVDMNRFLPQMVQGLTQMDPESREMLDALIQAVHSVQPRFAHLDAMQLANHLAGMIGDDVVVALKRDDYLGAPEDPKPLLSIFLQVKDRGPSFDALEAEGSSGPPAPGFNGFVFPLMRAHSRLEQEGRGVAKWYNVWHEKPPAENERLVQEVILTGTTIRTVAFGIIDPNKKKKGPWTLAVVLSPRTVEVEKSENDGIKVYELGTAHELITDYIKLSASDGDPNRATNGLTSQSRTVRSLLKSERYKAGGDFLEGFASVAMYLDAIRLKEVLGDYTASWAQEETEIDWEEETARIEEGLLAGEFSSWRDKEMPRAIRTRFEQAVEAAKEELDQERRMSAVPELQNRFRQNLAWIDLLEDAFLAARIDEASQRIEVRARIRTRLDD